MLGKSGNAGWKIEKDPNSENGGKISKEPIFVSEQEYLERLDSLSNLSQWTNQEKILFLYGVFFQRAINLEKQKLSSEKLKKQFTRFFPRMNNVNTHILGSQISYTLLSLWVYEEIHSKSTFFGIFPILRWQLFSLMKKVDDITTRSKLSLAFMQGFDAFNRIMASKNERD